jgi:hypothetical protein
VTAGRAQGVTLAGVAAVAWMRTLVLPALGPDAALAFGRRAHPIVMGTPLAPPGPTFGILLALALVLTIVALALGAPREIRWRLAAAYGLVTAGSLTGALGDARAMLLGVEPNARYAFVPGVLALWLLLFNVQQLRSARSLACALVLAWGLGAGAGGWRETLRWREQWPEWPAQVTAWRWDPRTPLHIWPRGWTMELVPRP